MKTILAFWFLIRTASGNSKSCLIRPESGNNINNQINVIKYTNVGLNSFLRLEVINISFNHEIYKWNGFPPCCIESCFSFTNKYVI